MINLLRVAGKSHLTQSKGEVINMTFIISPSE